MTFKDFSFGDMFNTKAARWVKISETRAICVMSSLVEIGSVEVFGSERDDLIPLFRSCVDNVSCTCNLRYSQIKIIPKKN